MEGKETRRVKIQINGVSFVVVGRRKDRLRKLVGKASDRYREKAARDNLENFDRPPNHLHGERDGNLDQDLTLDETLIEEDDVLLASWTEDRNISAEKKPLKVTVKHQDEAAEDFDALHGETTVNDIAVQAAFALDMDVDEMTLEDCSILDRGQMIKEITDGSELTLVAVGVKRADLARESIRKALGAQLLSLAELYRELPVRGRQELVKEILQRFPDWVTLDNDAWIDGLPEYAPDNWDRIFLRYDKAKKTFQQMSGTSKWTIRMREVGEDIYDTFRIGVLTLLSKFAAAGVYVLESQYIPAAIISMTECLKFFFETPSAELVEYCSGFALTKMLMWNKVDLLFEGSFVQQWQECTLGVLNIIMDCVSGAIRVKDFYVKVLSALAEFIWREIADLCSPICMSRAGKVDVLRSFPAARLTGLFDRVLTESGLNELHMKFIKDCQTAKLLQKLKMGYTTMAVMVIFLTYDVWKNYLLWSRGDLTAEAAVKNVLNNLAAKCVGSVGAAGAGVAVAAAGVAASSAGVAAGCVAGGLVAAHLAGQCQLGGLAVELAKVAMYLGEALVQQLKASYNAAMGYVAQCVAGLMGALVTALAYATENREQLRQLLEMARRVASEIAQIAAGNRGNMRVR